MGNGFCAAHRFSIAGMIKKTIVEDSSYLLQSLLYALGIMDYMCFRCNCLLLKKGGFDHE